MTDSPENLMVDAFFEPAGPAEVEEKIRRSRFIARLEICRSDVEVRDFLGRVEAEHRNATHNCWAYRLGPDPETEYSSDAGEPSGTAGRPILSALKKNELHNAAIVVTRYFGGIKLGVRGLIEAYGQLAELAVRAAGRLQKVRALPLEISLPYDMIGQVTRLLEEHGAVGSPCWHYASEVDVTAELPVSSAEAFTSVLDEFQARDLIFSWGWL
ncbi:MAG: YigZ family protein [Fretibacterium sp.]|nr:YigZ family protein [Fretibacterium sp.]